MEFIPRPYQQEAIRGNKKYPGIIRCLSKNRSTLVVMPTGSGKTVVFSVTTKLAKTRVLILAHRDELINQAADKIRMIAGISPDIEQAESYAMRVTPESPNGKMRAVVASVQTLHKPSRLRSFSHDAFGLIIIDEAHRASKENKSYQAILDYFPKAKVVGVTACADRHDKKLIIGPDKTFQSLAYEYLLPDAIEDGYLVPIRQGYVTVEDLDLTKIHTKRGEYDEAELAAILLQEKPLHSVVEPTLRLAAGRQGIVFAVNVAHATALARMFNRYSPDSVILMHGKITDKEYRKRIVDDFKAGKYQFLVNCDVYTEGFDAPNVSIIVNAGITKSRTKYMQRVGRGTRVLPEAGIDKLATSEERRQAIAASSKPSMLVLDFTDKMRHLSLSVSVADILARAELDEMFRRKVVARAKGLLEDDGEGNVDEALGKARKLVEDESKLEAVQGKTAFNYEEIDPFEFAQLLASEKQRDLVRKLTKREPPIDLTSKEAAKIVTRSFYMRGSISPRQIDFLSANGYARSAVNDYSHHYAERLMKQIIKSKRLASAGR